MTKNKYKKWASKFLIKVPKKTQKLFFKIVDLGDNLRKSKVRYHVESSFNTMEKFKVVKATYCFHYSKLSGRKKCQDFIKGDILLNIFKKISDNFKFKFNRKILDFILSIPLSHGRKNDVIVFYVDFNSFSSQFDKISIGLNPVSTKFLPTIGKFLGIKRWESLYQNFTNIENIIFDFYPNGEYSLKIYQAIKASSKILRKEEKNVFQQLNKLKPIKRIGLLTRFRNNKPFSKDIYFRCKGLDFKQFSKMSCFSSHKSFLEQIKPHVKNFGVSFIAIKNKQLEVYFR